MHYLAHRLSTFIQIPIIVILDRSLVACFIVIKFAIRRYLKIDQNDSRTEMQELNSDDFQIVAVTMVTSIYKVFLRILICW